MTDQKASRFVEQTKKRIENQEDATSIAEQNAETANASINQQIYALKSEQVKRKRAVDQAKKNLDTAKYPVDLIQDGQAYVDRIADSKNAIKEAEENLKVLEVTLKDFEEMLESEF